MNLHDYAVREMDISWPESDPMQDIAKKNVLELIDAFIAQAHSGVSGAYVLSVFERLVRFKPLTPLTGKDDEWSKPWGNKDTQQNLRCSSVFRDHFDNSTAHNIHGKVFSDDGKVFYSTRDSVVHVDFPYLPPVTAERVILKDKTEGDTEE